MSFRHEYNKPLPLVILDNQFQAWFKDGFELIKILGEKMKAEHKKYVRSNTHTQKREREREREQEEEEERNHNLNQI